MAGLNVLHVDDEPDVRLLVKLSLDLDADISTHSASSGHEAIDAASRFRPDVILLDAVMPGMDGLATLRALQANPRTADIPVLFLTGKCDGQEVDELKAGGSAGVLTKPFDPRALAALVRDQLSRGAEAAISAPTAFPSPDGVGRPGTMGEIVEALVLGGGGQALALTITDRAASPGLTSGLIPGLTPGLAPGSGELVLASPHEAAGAALQVQVAPVDIATLSSMLGMDATMLPMWDHFGTASMWPTGASVSQDANGLAAGDWSHNLHGASHSSPSVLAGGTATDWIATAFPRGHLHS